MYELEDPITYRKLMINLFVFFHYTIYKVNAKLKRLYSQIYFNTPRHYLDFVTQFVKLYNEKRNEMEEQQRHLNIGLHKLDNTVTEVEDLRKSLSIKNLELESKNDEANQKLSKMVENQQAAEKKRRMNPLKFSNRLL